jgi:hypothetical protein
MANLWVTPEELEAASTSPYAYEACQTASFILWALSGRKYTGVQTVTETYEFPCRLTPHYVHGVVDGRDVSQNEYAGFAQPYVWQSSVVNVLTGGNCGCSGSVNGQHVRLRLRNRPVRSISKVTIGSTTLDPSEYQVVNASMLQTAPGASWDLNGVTVTYTYGVGVPHAGRRAARYLANEFVKGWSGEECELPDRVTSISRFGQSMTILDNQTVIDDMRTGIGAVDLFLKAVNPDKARKPARVFSPDLPKVVQVTSNHEISAGPFDLLITPGEAFTWTQNLVDIGGTLLLDGSWSPQGQISSWNGALLLDTTSNHLTVTNDDVTLSLSASETGTINIGGSGVWDLYAFNTVDGRTVVHILTSNVYLV